MRIAIIRRESGNALSMDVYADNLVARLKELRPEWEIIEIAPKPWNNSPTNSWDAGNPVRKYYERFWNYESTCWRQSATFKISSAGSHEKHLLVVFRRILGSLRLTH